MNQISPLAYIHPDAKLGDGNVIGHFAALMATPLSVTTTPCLTM